ncbi:hypothetical protein D3C87_1655750 [compost metagenome]
MVCQHKAVYIYGSERVFRIGGRHIDFDAAFYLQRIGVQIKGGQVEISHFEIRFNRWIFFRKVGLRRQVALLRIFKNTVQALRREAA